MKIHHYASHLKDANLTIVNTEHTTIETLESLRENLKKEIDLYIDSLYKQTKGHTTTRGFVVHPLIHIIHDDENLNNEEYINYIKKERENQLNKLGI
jgi:hypothetical protein